MHVADNPVLPSSAGVPFQHRRHARFHLVICVLSCFRACSRQVPCGLGRPWGASLMAVIGARSHAWVEPFLRGLVQSLVRTPSNSVLHGRVSPPSLSRVSRPSPSRVIAPVRSWLKRSRAATVSVRSQKIVPRPLLAEASGPFSAPEKPSTHVAPSNPPFTYAVTHRCLIRSEFELCLPPCRPYSGRRKVTCHWPSTAGS